MNSIFSDYYPVFELYQSLRAQLLDILTDADLAYRPHEQTETLVELCRDIGETEMSYIVYNEALLIFYGQVSVYLKAMGKPIPQQWQEWVG